MSQMPANFLFFVLTTNFDLFFIVYVCVIAPFSFFGFDYDHDDDGDDENDDDDDEKKGLFSK